MQQKKTACLTAQTDMVIETIAVLYFLMTGIGKTKSITYVPWPSLSDGEARSLEALKTPRVIADAAKCRAPTSFLLQDPDGKSFVTSQLPA
jgi:hypothetical protein